MKQPLAVLVAGLLALCSASQIAAAQTDTSPRPTSGNDERDWFDWAVGGAQILAILGVGAVIYQIRAARKEARIQRSATFLQRYFAPEQRSQNSVALAFFDVEDAEDCVTKIGAWLSAPHGEDKSLPRSPRDGSSPQASRNGITAVLDFFEEFGAAYNKKLLDKDMVHATIAPIPVQMLNVTWWYVCWRRKGLLHDQHRLYSEWELAVRAIGDEREELKEGRPNPGLRLLVLPRDDKGAWHMYGRGCARLSKALSGYLAADGSRTLESVQQELANDVLKLDRESGGNAVASVLPIPPTIDVDAEEWDAARCEAETIKGHLSGLDLRGLAWLADTYEARVPAPAP